MKKLKCINVLMLVLLATWVLVPRDADARDARTTVSYLVGFPTSDTHDFIKNTSFLGFELDFGIGLFNPNLESSFVLGFQRFEKDENNSVYNNPDSGLTITGDQERSLDSYPILYKLRYLPTGPSQAGAVNGFLGLGVGITYVERRLFVGSFNFSEYGIQPLLRPEVGVNYRFTENSAVEASARYDWGIETGDLETLGSFTVGLGYTFYY